MYIVIMNRSQFKFARYYSGFHGNYAVVYNVMFMYYVRLKENVLLYLVDFISDRFIYIRVMTVNKFYFTESKP